MTTRIETQFGAVKDLGTTYTLCGSAVSTGHEYNLHLNVTNLLTSVVKVRAYIADTSWGSGAPSGSTKVAALAFDMPVAVGQTIQITGIVLTAAQKLVVRSDTTAGLDVVASGVDITL